MAGNTSIDLSAFERLWAELKSTGSSGSFDYTDPNASFCNAVDDHFRRVVMRPRYGVYVIRRTMDNEVVYIGKGGTIKTDGTFKTQDVPRRHAIGAVVRVSVL